MHKLLLTGKGRCNLTNNCDPQTALASIKTNPRFLQSAFHGFTPQDTCDFFEQIGVRLKTERGGRIFPVSDKSDEVVSALNNRMNILGVELIADRAISLITSEKAPKNVLMGVKCEKKSYHAPKLLIATGGMSYPRTGSTGDGYKLSRAVGHNIVEPKPALVPIITREDCGELAGLSLRNIKLFLYSDSMNGTGKPLYAEQGELLFTHSGISGPLPLSASCYIKNHENYTILIDLKPALDLHKLDLRILRDFDRHKNKQLQNALHELLPNKLILPVISQANIPPDKQINAVTAPERQRLTAAVKHFKLTVAALAPIDEAIITDGGVDTREIDPKTMQSKLVSGLHFAGEVIDVAGFTGGFNLQIAFSTAYAAVGN